MTKAADPGIAARKAVMEGPNRASSGGSAGSTGRAQIGAIVGLRLKAEQLRVLLSLLVLGVALRIGVDLLIQPDELYTVAPGVLP